MESLVVMMVCVRCDQWEDQVKSLKKILRQKEEEVQLLATTLEKKTRAVRKLLQLFDWCNF